MKDHIAIVKNENNKVTKYQDFDSKAEADAHVTEYGGFVVDKPDDDRMVYWVVDADNKTVTFDKSQADTDDGALAANAYKATRKNAYPDVGDQLDALFHAGAFPEDMTEQIQAVKDANPK